MAVDYPPDTVLSIDCKCKKKLCHDKRFGLYCGLHVAEEIERVGVNTMFSDKVKALMTVA